ncbi:Uncharacterized protein HZ326_25640 [Fusarium oxysporum f. sp. albedinis]|nr:Uncharacterized protein HZ326_25640 [Fusarium oxysporum f. sp. albedinis]
MLFLQVIRSRSHEAVRRAPEKALSGSVDTDGMERISIAIRLSRGILCPLLNMRQGWEPLNVLQYIEWIDDQRQFNSINPSRLVAPAPHNSDHAKPKVVETRQE